MSLVEISRRSAILSDSKRDYSTQRLYLEHSVILFSLNI